MSLHIRVPAETIPKMIMILKVPYHPDYAGFTHRTRNAQHLILHKMRSSRCLSFFENVYASRLIISSRIATRGLHKTTVRHTDGVYTALTEMRVRTPWIEALRTQQKDGIDPRKKSAQPATPPARDLTPKKMSDSYHRVVCTIAAPVLYCLAN